ncbi:hypothetical protein [Streptomyces sp. NPDC051909]|uniref:hypothetical protein n=1 Tax=Streptomyces sp. NPDC051909 TaxID=3154944 RepID=UPI0034346BC8
MGTEPIVCASVTYPEACPDCGARLVGHGVQALVGDRLRWDVESSCVACGYAVAACDTGPPPPGHRVRLLAEHGPAVLRLGDEPASGRVSVSVVMRVLRALPGSRPDLAQARDEARRILAGEWTGTLPETERLARGLRAAGVAAEAVPATEPAQRSG